MASFKKRAVISASNVGDNQIIPATAGSEFVVTSYALVFTAAASVVFESGTDGDDLTGTMAFAANGGICAPDTPSGHFSVQRGKPLNMRLSAAATVGGYLNYTEITS